jgi:hypothetical protein
METSKKVLWLSWIVAIVLTIVAIFGDKYGVNTDNATTLACLAWGEVTAVHGFYMWKSKNENRSKHAMNLVRELADKYGIENVTGIIESVLKD